MVCKLLGMRTGDLRVHAAEIGGAFGGKTVVYVEPVAVVLARKSGHPVKIMMSREEVFKGTGTDLRRVDDDQDRRHARRQDRRRGGALQVPGGRLPRLAGHERLHVRLRAVRHSEPAHARL